MARSVERMCRTCRHRDTKPYPGPVSWCHKVDIPVGLTPEWGIHCQKWEPKPEKVEGAVDVVFGKIEGMMDLSKWGTADGARVVTRDECEDVLCAIAAARAERALGEGRVVELKEGQILAASGDDGLTVHYQGPCRLTITRLPDKEPEKVRPVVVEGWLWDKGVLEAKGLWCPKCRWISPEDVTICDRCGASFGEPCDLPEVPDER